MTSETLKLVSIAAGVLGGIGFTFGILLALALAKLHVPTDPREEQILKLLPGANCGACGFPGCSGLSAAIVSGKAPVDACPGSNSETHRKIGEIMGTKVEEREKKVATVCCLYGNHEFKKKYIYIKDCRLVSNLPVDDKTCPYACLGFGTCVEVCAFDAIKMGEKGLPVVDIEKCTGCGVCVENCPKGILMLIPASKPIKVSCKSLAIGKEVRKVCEYGCIACKVCEKNCPEKAVVIKDNLAVRDYSKCKLCGTCVEKCPRHCEVLIKT